MHRMTRETKMELKMAQITTLENGLVVRIDNFDDRDNALREAGLHD